MSNKTESELNRRPSTIREEPARAVPGADGASAKDKPFAPERQDVSVLADEATASAGEIKRGDRENQ